MKGDALMAIIQVDPGICGMRTTIQIESADAQTCSLTVDTPCEAIAAMAEEIRELDGLKAAFTPFAENPVYLAAGRHYKHAACPIPSAIIKAAEIACGLALPQDVSFEVDS